MEGIGQTYERCKKTDSASKLYGTALEKCENGKLTESIVYANLLIDIGRISEGVEDYRNALLRYSKAIKVYEKLKMQNTFQFATNLRNIGGVYLQRYYVSAINSQGQAALCDSSLVYFLAALKRLQVISQSDTNDYADLAHENYADIASTIGECYISRKDYKNAIFYTKKAISAFEDIGWQKTFKHGQAVAELSSAYFKIGDTAHGLELGEKLCDFNNTNISQITEEEKADPGT